MFDYTAITTFTNKSKPNLSYLKATGNMFYGWEEYHMQGLKPLQVLWKPAIKEIKIRGSLPYFWQEHNFSFSHTEMRNAFEFISHALDINIYEGLLEGFEYGKVLKLPYTVDTFLRNHIKLKGFKTIPFESLSGEMTGKYFESKTLKVKLYNVAKNFTSKVRSEAMEALQSKQPFEKGKSFLRVENHYKRPLLHFKERILVTDLFHTSFIDLCKQDLIHTYQNIMKNTSYFLPNNKKALSASILPLLVLKDLENKHGFNVEELLYNKLKSIPETVINANDRKARRKQLRKMLESVTGTSNANEYDISSLLKEALQIS